MITRVTSPWRASTCRSNISRAWSAYAAGTPTGRSRSGKRAVPRVGLGLLNAALDLAHGLEVLADPGAIGRAERVLQAERFHR